MPDGIFLRRVLVLETSCGSPPVQDVSGSLHAPISFPLVGGDGGGKGVTALQLLVSGVAYLKQKESK